MMSSAQPTVPSTASCLQMIAPPLTMCVLLTFAFLTAFSLILSLIPIYIANQSVPKTSSILTTVRISNYLLQMNRSLAKRDLLRAISSSNTTMSLTDVLATMNSSVTYALEQQLQAGDAREQFDIYILQMTPNTNNINNMSLLLDFLIVYKRECMSCDQHRRLVIFNQLCSNNPLTNSIRFAITYANLSYSFSNPVTLYTPYIPIANITIITQIIVTSQLASVLSSIEANGSTQSSNKFLASNYTLVLTTSKTNYFANLDEATTSTSGSQNDGPVALAGATTMYSGLAQIINQQVQSSNGSNAVNITINTITLQFWYENSTVQVVINFLITFSTSCYNQCLNQRTTQLTSQLGNLTNTQINVQPANITDGQAQIFKNGTYVLYAYSLTSQVISNFTGTVAYAIPPALTILYS